MNGLRSRFGSNSQSRGRLAGGALGVLATAFVIAACAGDEDNVGTTPTTDAGSFLPETGAPQPDAGGDGSTDVPIPPAPAVCGNGKKEAGEACDDGNKSANDGCSDTCTVESAFDGDSCPGKTIALATDGTALRGSVTGTTTGAFNQYGSACGGGSGKDVVYSFTSAVSGKAKVTMTADFAAIVSARTSCDTATSESKCADVSSSPTGGTASFEVPVFANAPVFVFVDGYGGTSGGFTIDVEVSTAVCGNGIAEVPEACDDGNATGGDGCSATCTLETGGVLKQCPGQPFVLSGPAGQPRKISFSGNTATDGAATQNPTGCFYWNGNNVVYAIQSDIDGSAKASLVAGYAKSNVHARSDCGSNTYQLGCIQTEKPGNSAIDFPVRAGQWFYVFVDGDSGGGPYSLSVDVNPAACGNGVIDGTETCDDGNQADGDGCSATCEAEPLLAANACPGHALALAPQADGSRTATLSSTTTGRPNSVKTSSCTTGTAADAVFAVTPDIDGRLSATVAGPFNVNAAILSNCIPQTTGDSTPIDCTYKPNATSDPYVLTGLGSNPKSVSVAVKAGVTYFVRIDSSSTNGSVSGPFKLDVKVTPPVCGNGVLEGTETCDDGAADDNDGCSSTCQIEPLGTRSSCALAEAVNLVPGAPGNYSASLARGTTGFSPTGATAHNFATSTTAACYANGRNAYFSVTAPAAGVLRAVAKSTAFDVVLGFRKPSCATSGAPLMCANDSGKGNEEAIATPVAAGETVFVIVDTKGDVDFGRFTLDVTLGPSGCADGFLVPSPDEECDDGNTTNGDGCSATCKLEPVAGVDKCPGVLLPLSGTGFAPRRGTITFDTASLAADYTGACGGSGKDGVVRIKPDTNGILRARLRNMPTGTVHARSVCADPQTEFLKTSGTTCPSVVHDTVSFSVTAGQEYFVFVDGLDGATGVPSLDVTVTP